MDRRDHRFVDRQYKGQKYALYWPYQDRWRILALCIAQIPYFQFLVVPPPPSLARPWQVLKSNLVDLVTQVLVTFLQVVAYLLIALLVCKLISKLIYELRLRRKARHDYRVARGTQHLCQLRSSLSALKADILTVEKRIKEIKKQKRNLQDQKREELHKALCWHLVRERLTEVKSIGPELSARIINRCFHGNLRDLQSAEYIFGIGPTRQRAIMEWIYTQEKELPHLLKGPFPGKQKIGKEYSPKEEKLNGMLASANQTLAEKQDLYKSGQEFAERLESIDIAHFRKTLRKGASEEGVPNWYFEGVYPAWEAAPAWFETLLKQYGGS
jgi:hypothetical protein